MLKAKGFISFIRHYISLTPIYTNKGVPNKLTFLTISLI